MSTKIINYITKLINENCNDDDFISDWYQSEKDKVLEFIKALEKKSSSKKKKKDKNAPKKNLSTWILFSKAERPKVKKEFPDMKPKEVMGELAKRWKIAKEDEDAMEEFKILAEEDKKRYEEEKKNYVPPENEEEDSGDDDNNGKKKRNKGKGKKKTKAPGQPKNAKSAWLFFCEEERKKLKDEEDTPKGKEILTELASRWKALKEKGGKKYSKFETLAKNDKERYIEEMKNFLPNEYDKEDDKEDIYNMPTQQVEVEFEDEEKPLQKRGRKKANNLNLDDE